MKTLTKKMFLLLFALFISLGIKAQVMDEWSYFKDNGNTDRALIVNPEGSNYIHVAGTTQKPEGLKLYSRKYHNNGTWQWSRTGNTVLPGPVLFMKRDESLNTFIVCINTSTGIYSILKYGRDAVQRWKKNFSERPVGLEIDGSGKVYTGGQAAGGFYARCYRNSNGAVIWARSESSGREAKAMDIDNAGNVVVGGIDGLASDDDMRIVKFGISSYSFIWATNWNGPDGNRDNVDLLTVDAVGNVYVSGEIAAYGSMGTNVSVAKFNVLGFFQWKHLVTGGSGSSGQHEVKLLVDPAQNPVLVVHKLDFYNVNPAAETDRILVTKLNRNTGAELFKTYPNDPGYSNPGINEAPVCASLDQYGNVYIGGYGNNGGFASNERRWTITKVDGVDGNLRWVEAGNTIRTEENQVNDVYVSSGGDVYLAITEIFTTPDFEIVKFSQPGGGLRLASIAPQEQISTSNEVSIYPNPSSDKFTFMHPYPGETADVLIFDLTGKLVREYKNTSDSFEFGEDLSTGMYYVTIVSGQEKKTIKIIKAKE